MKLKFEILFPITIILSFFLNSCNQKVNLDEYKIWHKVELSFTGPNCSELGTPNPFTDYRLDAKFISPSGKEFSVPGFFAADGNAAETNAELGNIWKVRFTPNESGVWSYSVRFIKGNLIAADLTGGESGGYFDKSEGEFRIVKDNNSDPKDFRNKGKLVYTDEPFLRFIGSGEYYIKGGANSPEVLLEYSEFDNTPSLRKYLDHIKDWKEGDPLWGSGKGKGIIGVVNYLSSLGVNSFYFLTMNAYGDGKNAWPWIDKDSVYNYDCSKLEQWSILFDHMISKGIMPHFVLTETENESMFEIKELGSNSGFAKSRKIYFREMIARFGYLCAVTWNIGEENGWEDGEGYLLANSDDQRRLFAEYLRKLTYYNDHITIHNGPSTDDYIFDELLQNNRISGPALQWDYGNEIYSKVLEWRTKSDQNGNNWVINMDEPWIHQATDSVDVWRKEIVWSTFMAGGAGIELYIGAGLDLVVENFREYEDYYKTMAIAVQFFRDYVPFWNLKPSHSFVKNIPVLLLESKYYVLYLKNGGSKFVKLPNQNYEVNWFNPRSGGQLLKGSILEINGGELTSIGEPPKEKNRDWICLIKAKW